MDEALNRGVPLHPLSAAPKAVELADQSEYHEVWNIESSPCNYQHAITLLFIRAEWSYLYQLYNSNVAFTIPTFLCHN